MGKTSLAAALASLFPSLLSLSHLSPAVIAEDQQAPEKTASQNIHINDLEVAITPTRTEEKFFQKNRLIH
jgi:hypothetical protein